MPRKKWKTKIAETASPYTFEQEELIEELLSEKIEDLQRLTHDKKGVLSDRQLEATKGKLERCQELQYQNRLNRQINMNWR